MNSKLKMFISLISLAGAGFLFASCNTADGVGKDIEDLGEGVQDAAN